MAILDVDFQFMPEGRVRSDISGFEPIFINNLEVRVTEDAELIYEAKRLRYKVFYEEGGAIADEATRILGIDQDLFDRVADHLVVLDHSTYGKPKVVGTYRLTRESQSSRVGGFYSSQEFDLTRLEQKSAKLLELGRACVHPEFRNLKVLNALWCGISAYIDAYDIAYMFGCASFPGIEIDGVREAFSFLHHEYLAPEDIRPRALNDMYIPMNWMPLNEIDARRAFKSLPPLVQGYLRAGALVGDGAIADENFQTIDICILLDASYLQSRFLHH
ncbi:MAG: GNAT family N-acyltransferase [Alphaproteobacteria bacterium]|nr:GNAT family N-acyltransferase [Alphaproteobacteria bacterium]